MPIDPLATHGSTVALLRLLLTCAEQRPGRTLFPPADDLGVDQPLDHGLQIPELINAA